MCAFQGNKFIVQLQKPEQAICGPKREAIDKLHLLYSSLSRYRGTMHCVHSRFHVHFAAIIIWTCSAWFIHMTASSLLIWTILRISNYFFGIRKTYQPKFQIQWPIQNFDWCEIVSISTCIFEWIGVILGRSKSWVWTFGHRIHEKTCELDTMKVKWLRPILSEFMKSSQRCS